MSQANHHASKRRTLIGLTGLALGTSALWSSMAQGQAKTIRFILPVATASGVDTITARRVAGAVRDAGLPRRH